MRILIVDDEAAIVEVASRQLRAEGWAARGAGSAEDAILLARSDHFDVILLDVDLPGASGLTAINTLKSMSGAAILVMTGHADEEIRRDALLLGADELIAKPFEHRQLISVIRDISSRADRGRRADRKGPSDGRRRKEP